MKKQKVLAMLLGLCLAVTQLPMSVLAADFTDQSGLFESEAIAVSDIAIERDLDDSIEAELTENSEELLVFEEDESEAVVSEEELEITEEDAVPEELPGSEAPEKEKKAAAEDELKEGTATQISNASQLAEVRNNLAGTYVLTSDIVVSNTEWTPIGVSDSEPFTGIFDGAGHKITIGTVSGTSYSFFGLFGVAKNATIKNLDVEITVTGGQTVGGIIGYAYNVVLEACSSQGSLTADNDMGGLIGLAENTFVRNCYSMATVTSNSSSDGDGAGGLIGEMYATHSGKTQIISSYAAGEIRKEKTTGGIGGLTGRQSVYASGVNIITFSFYGETGPSDTCRGYSVLNSELKDSATFVGWDFNNIWAMDDTKNDGYPYLKRTGEYQSFNLSGKGTADDPYLVTNELELAAIARNEIGTDNFSYCYKLVNDITLTGTYWTPIGGNGFPSFTGTFDGAGHKISNMKIGSTGYNDQGLFGYTGGTIKNLDVVDAVITESYNAGVLIGSADGAIVEACSSSGEVTGNDHIGGLIGFVNNTTIRNSYSTAKVTNTSSDGGHGAGGLVGYFYSQYGGYSKIIMCYAAGAVKKEIESGRGGLIGLKGTYTSGHVVILDSYFSSRTGQDNSFVGFLCAHKKMKQQSTYTYWDFDNVWQINASENDGLPTLKRAKEYKPVKLQGQGTAKSPYIIKDEYDLASVARGEVGAGNYTSYYKLANNITLTSEYWTPIGGNGVEAFSGKFDGQGYTISGLTIIYPGYEYSGIFGYATGTITNLNVTNVNLVDVHIAGAIVGEIDGAAISYCSSDGNIEGDWHLGGIVGYVTNSRISNSFSRVNVTSTSSDGSIGVGGIAGYLYGSYGNYATVIDCYAAGKLTKEKTANGICGITGVRGTYTSGNTVIYDSFYDTQVTTIDESTYGIGVKTSEMKSASTYTYWDFKNVWAIDPEKNDGYPYLTFKGEYQGAVPEGAGVKIDPYVITNEYELAALAKGELDYSAYYELDNDIVITSKHWIPIGYNGMPSFSGVFEGNGYTISGLTNEVLCFSDEGLFGSVSGTVQNLRVSGNIKNAYGGGMLVAVLEPNGKITNCATVGSFTGKRNIGGLIGYSHNAVVKDCYSRVDVTNTSTDYNIGGLIGEAYADYSNKNTFDNCYATGKVDRTGGTAGGLIGKTATYTSGSNVITSCYYDNLNDGSTDKGTYTATDNMKLQSTYVDWDFSKTWSIASTENDGYPQLQIFAGSEIPGPSDVKVTGVSLNKSSLTLTIGENETLTATVLPVTATNKNITWSTSDAKIANVDTTGKVTAEAKGTATITVTTEDGNKTATCAVTVGDGTVETTGVALNKKTLSLEKGKTEALTVSFTPEDATDKEVTFASSNTSVATVSDAGVVTAVAAGTTTITVSLKSNPTIADTCEVTVTPTVIKTTGVTLNKKTLSLEKGKTEALTVSFTPADATDKTVTFASDNTAVATVSADGTVTAVAKGTANITVTLNSDSTVSDTCVVTVTESEDPGPGPGPGPEPDPEPTEVTYQVRFYVDGYENGELKKVTIAAGDTLYEAMPETSEVLELIPDGATFLGWYIDGTNTLWDITAPVNRNLDLEARYISPDADEGHEDPGSGRDPGMIQEEGSGEEIGVAYYYDVYMVSGQSYTFPVNYSELDGGTGTGKITWKTSDKTFIKITSKYKAKALKATGATDEVFVFDGNSVTDSVFVYAIHIVAPSITQNGAAVPKSQTLLKGETVNLEVAGFGEYEDYFDISWNTSNAEIARVDDGIVTATGKGTAKISAFVNGKAFTCSVKVVDSQKPDKITAKTSIKLAPLQAATLKFSVSGLKAKGLEWQDESGNALTAYTKDGAKASTGDKISYYQNDVVRLTPTGKVTAVGTGDCVVIAKDNKNGGSAQVTVKVPEQAANVIYLNKGKTKNIKYYNVKSSAKSTSYTLGSADERNIVALNDTKGSVKGLNAGKATVTCTADPYGTGKGIKYSTIVFVENPTLDISSNKWSKPNKTQTSATLTLTKGEKFVIKVNDTYQPIIFTSNKDSVAFVDEAGVVSARNVGKATLTARVNGMKVTVKVVVGN